MIIIGTLKDGNLCQWSKKWFNLSLAKINPQEICTLGVLRNEHGNFEH